MPAYPLAAKAHAPRRGSPPACPASRAAGRGGRRWARPGGYGVRRTPTGVRRGPARPGNASPGGRRHAVRRAGASTHDHRHFHRRPPPHPDEDDPPRTGRLARLLSTRPRRSLLAVFLFVLVAGFFGGPVAGSLESGGGFATSDADSVQAIERIEAATGRSPVPGSSSWWTHRTGARGRRPGRRGDRGVGGRARHRRRRRRRPRPAGTPPGLRVDRRHPGARARHAGRRRGRRRASASRCSTPSTDRTTSPSVAAAVVGLQLGSTVGEDLGRAELFAFPLLVLLSLIFFRGPRCADAAGRRRHDGARHVPGAHRRQRVLRR